jgi:uncharacterized protein YdaU (DUF1376 family)
VSDAGLPFLPWYPARFLSSTRGWPVTAKGVFRELLDTQWEVGGLPVDPAALRRLISATAAEWKHWGGLIEPKFPVDADGLRRNPRLEEHRAASIEKRGRNRAGAAKTNAKRWGTKVMRFPDQGAR